jgi:hypothetical protein
MTRRFLRRCGATVCAGALAAGILGVAVGGPASAKVPGQVATPPPPGSGVQITVAQDAQPIGPLSFT